MTASAFRGGTAPGGVKTVVAVGALAGLGAAIGVLIDPVIALAGFLGAAGAAVLVFDPTLGLAAIAVFAVLRLPEVATDFYGAPSLFTPLVLLIALATALHSLQTGRRPAGGWRAAVAGGSMVGVALASLMRR